MEQRLTFITLGVRDLAVMRTFYVEKFGWTPMQEEEQIVFFRLNGIVLALFPDRELASDISCPNDGEGFKRFSLSINFSSEEDVDRVFGELVSKGVRVTRQPERVFWGGYRGYVADPENNYWELAFNPFLSLAEDGSVAAPNSSS